ncbi:hypothetical protein CYLTODRAFT_422897, partial [Cylindrobasidium torrendii FP15055 ss-10]
MISIANLPDDILIAIFHRCTAPTEDIHFSSLDATSPPWILACVSRSWRAITISTPLLWAKIRIPLFLYPQTRVWARKYKPAKVVARTQHLLQLTQKCKLDIVIVVRHYAAITVWNELIPVICATAPRWQRFTSDASHSFFAALQVPESFPYLEHLGLHFSPMSIQASASDEAFKKIESFRNAHALRSLALIAIEDYSLTLELLLPWQNITVYSTNMGHMLNNSLHLLSDIETLHADLGHGHEDEAENDALTARPLGAVQVFPRLTTLIIDLANKYDFEHSLQPLVKTILHRLHAPSLTKLRLKITGFRFISKPLLVHCNLDNLLDLSISDDASCLSSDILDFWRLTPNVEVLHLRVGGEIHLNALLSDLLAFPGVPVPLQRLKVLCLDVGRVNYPSVICKIILQRRGALDKKLWAPLEEVRIREEKSDFLDGMMLMKMAHALETLKKEYERQKMLLPFYEDEGIAPLRMYAVQSDF